MERRRISRNDGSPVDESTSTPTTFFMGHGTGKTMSVVYGSPRGSILTSVRLAMTRESLKVQSLHVTASGASSHPVGHAHFDLSCLFSFGRYFPFAVSKHRCEHFESGGRGKRANRSEIFGDKKRLGKILNGSGVYD